jgi:mRNA-degrading endonuclease toxin of MazEF toxin-antitoxin module
MPQYQRGDVAEVLQVWREKDGSLQYKWRPGIIYDVLGEDHYSFLIFGKDRTGKIPGFKVEANSKDGKEMRLKKDSFINMEKIVKLRRQDMGRLKGYCTDELMEKIEKKIDEYGIERPLS